MQPLPPRVCTGTALSVLNQEPFFTPMTFYYFFIFHNSYLTTRVNYIQAQKRQTQVKTLERREQ